MPSLDLTTWALLFVALTPLLIAVIRRDSMSDDQVALLTVAVVAAAFFAGKALDGDLTWPLGKNLPYELGLELIGQQTIYKLVKKTSVIKRLEAVGNAAGPPRGLD